MDFTGYLDNAINFMRPSIDLRKPHKDQANNMIQTLPPTDECIPVFHTRPILIHFTEPSPLLAPPTPQKIPALQQDRVMEEFQTETLTPIEDRSSDNETPIHQVQPLLGTTHRENLQLRNRNTPEDIADVLGTTAFQGYVNTPV